MRTRKMIGSLIAATGACYFLIEGSQLNGIIGFYRDKLSAPMFMYWLTGLCLATLMPAACGVFSWWAAKRLRHGWILHLLLMPTIFAVYRVSVALMLFAAGEPNEDSLSGWALVPATLLLIICPVAYFAALGIRRISKLRKSANIY